MTRLEGSLVTADWIAFADANTWTPETLATNVGAWAFDGSSDLVAYATDEVGRTVWTRTVAAGEARALFEGDAGLPAPRVTLVKAEGRELERFLTYFRTRLVGE